MDLHSGLPFWIIKNALNDYYHPLKENVSTDVAIVGSGITGSLVAHELCRAGVKCAVFDKRTLTTGSSAASTAQLQYEIDVPLCRMVKIVDEDIAINAYQASLQSITDIENVFKYIHSNPDFKRVSSVYLASTEKDIRLLEREYAIRKKNNLPVSFLDKKQVKQKHLIDAPAALKNREAAQMDCYKGSTKILQYHQRNSGLKIFSHTNIIKWQENPRGYSLLTESGYTIKCKYVIIAAGFEATQFLPKQVMDLNSTYALVSQPVDPKCLWPERSLIWETKEPYFYMRTTADNRIMIGGEDVPFRDPVKRDKLLRSKINRLEKKFADTYPNIPFVTDMAWCGTFSSTKDGLPYIGAWPGKKRMLYALGYGGNGITFSMIAAQVITNILTGTKDNRQQLFAFDRKRKK